MGLIDEVRDHDGDTLNEIVLPLLNVSRRTANGALNPHEKSQAQFYMTSAGQKGTFAYEKLIELLQQEIISPETTFVWGCDYRIPMMHGLLSKDYLNEIKMSSTYKEESFAREYLGIWTGGGGAGSWFDFDKLSKRRTVVNPETRQKLVKGAKIFYLLSVDVARIGCQTVVSVFKVFDRKGAYHSNLVNIYVLGKRDEDRHFEKQARDLKEIIERFQPKEVVIDGNGLGVGLIDFMVKETIDDNGRAFPAYGSFNDKDYLKTQPRGCEKIIYVLKASATLDSKIHSNCYSRITSGLVHFLISERLAKNKLLEFKSYHQLPLEKKVERLLPHELTSKLFEEIGNLKLKNTQSLDVKLEQISKRNTKDKFSSFEYGLWRIKELEEENNKRTRKIEKISRQLVFYTKKGG